MLLAIPGTIGFTAPRYYAIPGVGSYPDMVLCGAASTALALGLAVGLSSLVKKRISLACALGLAVPLAVSAWGLTSWWMALCQPPSIPMGVLF